MPETFEEKTRRNFRVKARYDELMREGKLGHYETLFRVVREEIAPLQEEIALLRAQDWDAYQAFKNRLKQD